MCLTKLNKESDGNGAFNKFLELIKKLILVCQFFCVTPLLTVNSNNPSSIFMRVHHIWCLTILLYIYIINYIQASTIKASYTTVEKGLYLSEFLTNCIIITCTISSAYYYAEYYKIIPIKILKIYKELQCYLPKQSSNMGALYIVLHTELLCLMWSICGFIFCCCTIDLIYSDYNLLLSIRSSSAYNVPNLIISLSLGQYWLALRFIQLLHKRVNEILQNTSTPKSLRLNINADITNNITNNWYETEYSINKRNKRLLSSQFEVIKKMRRVYSDLNDILADVTTAYELVILLNFLGSFLDLAIEYFAVYKFFDKPHIYGLALFLYKVIWLVLHTGRIFFVLIPNNGVIAEKCITYYTLNQLTVSSKKMEHIVNRFLLQLVVQNPNQTVCGIFDLNLIFLGGITNALAIYTIFLIQIDLGNESLIGTYQNGTTSINAKN